MIVSNTSTLILLAKASVLNIFLDTISGVLIPKIVHEEIKNKDSFEVLSINNQIKKGKIKVLDIDKKYYENIIREFKLDDGEAAVYALYKKERGKLILTDDGELIKLCKIEQIPFTVAMAVVVKLYKKKKFVKAEALGKLENLYGYGRYSEEIYQYFKS